MKLRYLLLAWLLIIGMPALVWTASLKITERPVADTLDGTEILGIIQNGQDKQITSAEMGALGGSAQGLGPNFALTDGNIITGATESKPVKIFGSGGQVDKGLVLGRHSSGLSFIDCLEPAGQNKCDYYRQLDAGFNAGYKNSTGNIGFQYQESTNKVTVLANNQVDDQVWMSDSATAGTMRTVPNCTDAAGNHLNYTQSSNSFSCGNTSSATGGPTIVRKTADETVNNSSSRQNDDHLVFAVDASSYYVFDLLVLYRSSTTADFNIDFSVPASATGWWQVAHPGSGASACGSQAAQIDGNSMTDTNNSIGGVGASTTCSFTITGHVTVAGTAGNVQFRWAQTTPEVSDTKVMADSWLRWQKL